jgi:primosomal protein N' (replication factor Y)
VSLVEAMARREIDILLGTQMVAKGLDFPGVSLVGVLQADTGLHIPDFRASERTFQLLAQVAGRAGRADHLGEVVIQTYMPGEPSISAARTHDFERFAELELRNREELAYPPFCRLARIVVWGPHESRVREQAQRAAEVLHEAGKGALVLLGPAPAVIERIDNHYRHAIMVKSRTPTALQTSLAALRRTLPRSSRARQGVSIDVDPLQML